MAKKTDQKNTDEAAEVGGVVNPGDPAHPQGDDVNRDVVVEASIKADGSLDQTDPKFVGHDGDNDPTIEDRKGRKA